MGVPVYILTHEPPADWPGDSTIHFVTDGLESAVAQAREAAGGKDVGVATPSLVRQCLDAGLLDGLQINVVPIVLGKGRPFFDGIERDGRARGPRGDRGHRRHPPALPWSSAARATTTGGARDRAPGRPGAAAEPRTPTGERGANGSAASSPGWTTSAVPAAPRATGREVAERLGDDRARLVGEPPEPLVAGMQRADRARVGGDEQRVDDRPARVAGRVEPLAVAHGDGHLQRLGDAVAAPGLLDEPGHALQRRQRLLLQPEGQREVEHQLGVGRALDAREHDGIDREQQLAAQPR